jgi:phosphatidylserine/phosphatidylglycerophosphate/cardiolipin synthase-like enzyme
MVKFLDSDKITAELSTIIKDATIKVYLISPFLSFNLKYQQMIEGQNGKNVKIHIIYGKKESQDKNTDWLKALENVELKFCKNLHAKCYLNESTAIVTSMNFHDFSQKNNIEMGILIDKNTETSVYDEIWREIRRIEDASEVIKPFEEKKEEVVEEKESKLEGFCIRCGTPVKLDPKEPYCVKDWLTWKKFHNPAYVEEKGHCHICGKSLEASKEKPACKDCFKKHKGLFKDA